MKRKSVISSEEKKKNHSKRMSFDPTTTEAPPLPDCGFYNSSAFCDTSRCVWSCGKSGRCQCVSKEFVIILGAVFGSIFGVVMIATVIIFIRRVYCTTLQEEAEDIAEEAAGTDAGELNITYDAHGQPVTGRVISESELNILEENEISTTDIRNVINNNNNNHNNNNNTNFNSDDNIDFNNNENQHFYPAPLPPPQEQNPNPLFFPGSTYPPPPPSQPGFVGFGDIGSNHNTH
jgi:hypothetical protein